MNAIHRYPGVKPFESADAALFFGRDRDKTDLLDLVSREQLVLLFGKSGYGKSSLVKAGLIPDLIARPVVRVHEETGDEYEVHNCPVYIRFNLFGKNAASMPCDTLLQKLRECVGGDDTDPEIQAFLRTQQVDQTFWGAFKSSKTVAQKRFFLIFDQFEEFFSYPSDAQAHFRQQLSELLYTRIPQVVRDGMTDLDRSTKSKLHKPMEVHTLFSIRSDRIHLLNSMREELPVILQTRYELKALSESQAEEAIVRPALLESERFLVKKPFQYEPAALRKIIFELSNAHRTNANNNDLESQSQIEAFQLQIVCQTIEQNIVNTTRKNKGTQPVLVQESDLPDFDQIYEQYYEDRLADLPDETSRRTAYTMLEEEMVIGEDMSDIRRISIDKDMLRETMQHNHQMVLGQDILDYLEDKFLIRRETINGRVHYEVSHDVLLAPLLNSRNDNRKQAEELLAKQERAAAEARAVQAELDAQREREARKVADSRRKAARRTAIAAVVGFILAALMGLWAVVQRQKAEKLKEDAVFARIYAEEQRAKANNALKKVIDTKKEKLVNQIKLEKEAAFMVSAAQKEQLLHRIDSLEKAFTPYDQILNELEK